MAIPGVAFLRRRLLPTTLIQVMALDGIVNVNSLFSLAVFLGLTTTGPSSTASDGRNRRCNADAGTAMAERLVSSHVYSFSSFMFSSLVALALKQAIRTTSEEAEARGLNVGVGRVSMALLRVGILASGVGSVFGCGFLMMALVDLVQIKLGPLECDRNLYALGAIVPLLLLVPFALVLYVFLLLYAFTTR